MIIPLVLPDKSIICEIRDRFRISARIEAVAAVREENSGHRFIRDRINFGHRSFHLVEDYALVDRFITFSVDMPAFLIEDVRIFQDVRVKNAVKIDSHKIQVVLFYAAGYRIDCLVRECHRVEEGVHRGLKKLHERFLDRIFVRTAEHRVLQYVEHAGAVLRKGPESDREELVLVAVVRPYELCARGIMLHFDEPSADLLYFTNVCHGETVHLVIYCHLLCSGNIDFAFIDPLPGRNTL